MLPLKIVAATGAFFANGTSTSFALPVGATLILLQAGATATFRTGVGAGTASISSDTLILPGAPLLIAIPASHTHIALTGLGVSSAYSASQVSIEEP